MIPHLSGRRNAEHNDSSFDWHFFTDSLLEQVQGNAEASTAQYEALFSQWVPFSPAIVHRMLWQEFFEHGKTDQKFTCEVR